MSPHVIPIGTRLVLQLPFTPELLDGAECEPFCPGIVGTVTCWVIGHTPHGPDKHGYVAEPSYIISPYKTSRIGRNSMGELLAVGTNVPERVNPLVWELLHRLELAQHCVEHDVPERLLLPFVVSD